MSFVGERSLSLKPESLFPQRFGHEVETLGSGPPSSCFNYLLSREFSLGRACRSVGKLERHADSRAPPAERQTRDVRGGARHSVLGTGPPSSQCRGSWTTRWEAWHDTVCVPQSSIVCGLVLQAPGCRRRRHGRMCFQWDLSSDVGGSCPVTDRGLYHWLLGPIPTLICSVSEVLMDQV